MKTDSFDTIFNGKDCVMAIMPHPDDLELYCGGTIARLLAKGVDIVVVKLTNGGKGTRQSTISESELSKKRGAEDKKAAKVLGIADDKNIQLNLSDGALENDLATIEKLAALIRQYRPDLIITCNPEDVVIRFAPDAKWINHRDHRATAKSAVDAAYPYSRDTAFFPSQLAGLSKPFKPTSEFLFSDYYDLPDLVYVDITDFTKAKVESWACHESAYTHDKVEASLDFLNKDEESGRYYEPFRYVIAD